MKYDLTDKFFEKHHLPTSEELICVFTCIIHFYVGYNDIFQETIIVTGFGKTLRMGSVRDSRNVRFSSSGQNLSKSRFYYIHVEQPF